MIRQIAAAYIRVSTEDQIEFSPDSQIKKIKEYAKSHNMILSDKFIYIDEGISGRDAKHRPEFNRMIGTAKQTPKPFDVILVWKFSRFARNREDSIVYKSMLRKQCGISVVSISESLGDDKTSILIEALIEAMDEYYSINLAEEVRRGMTEKASRGGIVSVPAFGYKIEKDKYVPNDDAEFVKAMFEDFVDGMGYRAIARKYSELGAKTRAGNPLDNRFVEYLIRNPVYIGKIRWSTDGNGAGKRNFKNENMIITDGQHEPLVSNELFEQAQARADGIKSMYSKYQRSEQPVQFMLKGLVRCSNCGATLVYQSCKAPALQCHQYSRGACKVSHHVSIEKLNQSVLEGLIESTRTLNFGVENIEIENTGSVDVDKMIEKERKKLERARLAYTEGIDTIEEYKQQKEQIKRNIEALRKSAPKRKVAFDKEKFAVTIKNVIDVVTDEAATQEAKNIALRSVLSSITYNKATKSVTLSFKT